MQSHLKDAYLRFASLLESVEKAPGFPSLDPVEKKILESIAIAAKSGGKLLIGDIIFGNPLGSPATLGRRISGLANKNLIKCIASPEDARKKYLQLTPKSDKYFEKLGELLIKVSDS